MQRSTIAATGAGLAPKRDHFCVRFPALILAALIALIVPAAVQAEDHPVPWVALNGSDGQDRVPAGSNDWSCEPTKRHPNPVVLVHGLAANRSVNWTTMSPFLANRGYCVFALTYGLRDSVHLGVYQPGGMTRMQRSARELKRFVARVLNATGARRVDIVGHSQGSLMPNYWVKFLNGAKRVDDYVGVTPLWDGTNLAGLATLAEIGSALGLDQVAYDVLEPYCASCPQFVQGSRFLRKMSAGGGPAVPSVDYTMIMTRNDELVQPYTSGYMDGARNFVVQEECALDQSEHLSIIYDPVTAGLIQNALDRKHPEAVPCTVVLPFVGAPTYGGS
jgi:triacylglycerol lipase